MIRVDGERSLKRMPIAKKAVRELGTLNLLSGAGQFEGFKFKVWRSRNGKLHGGRVVAPFGVFVLVWDKGQGLQQVMCDSAQCAAGVVTVDKYLPYPRDPVTNAYESNLGPGLIMRQADPYPTAANVTASIPVCLPLGSEMALVIASWFEDTAPYGEWRSVNAVTHCYSTGQNDGDMLSIADAALGGTIAQTAPYRTIPTFIRQGYYEHVAWKLGNLYQLVGTKTQILAEYRTVYMPTASAYAYRVLTDMFFQPRVSADTWDKFVDSNNDTVFGVPTAQYAAHFSRVGNNFIGTMLVAPDMRLCTDSESVCATKYADPTKPQVPEADHKYSATLCFFDFVAGNDVVAGDVLQPLAISLLDGELKYYKAVAEETWGVGYTGQYAAYGVALYVFRRLFGYPSDSFYHNGERDTVTFADHLGVVYSWLRCCDPDAAQNAAGAAAVGTKQGGFKFKAPEGIVRVPLTMPDGVLEGTHLRPEILLMGDGVYSCAATNSNSEIEKLYVGSPFSVWEEVPPPAGVTLLAVKATQVGVDAASSGFVAVGRYTVDTGYAYKIFLKAAGAAWVGLSGIPIAPVGPDARFDVTLFGDDPLVQGLMEMKQFPVAREPAEPYHR